jgi:hypothetical protein
MNERLHACLDGELARDDLNAAERLELDALEADIGRAVHSLRAATAPDLHAAVMRRVGALPARAVPRPSWRARLRAAVWQPRAVTLSFRPAWALAAAAAAVALVFVLPGERSAGVAEPSAVLADAAGPPIYVQFRVHVADASSVALAGSFTDWQPRIELVESEPGVWSTLVPVTAGVHDYAFVIDGERWLADPHAPHIDDGFGGVNSRLSILLPGPTL